MNSAIARKTIGTLKTTPIQKRRIMSTSKRFHVHAAVDDLNANIRFYSTVFGMAPTVTKLDYAK